MKPFFVAFFITIGKYLVALWKDARILGATLGVLLQIAAVVAYYFQVISSSLLLISVFVLGWLLTVICLIVWGNAPKSLSKEETSHPVTEKKNSSNGSGWAGFKKIS